VGLAAVRIEQRERLPLGPRLAWLDQLLGGLQAGGVYFLAGVPGGRKSGLATQLALELDAAGIRSLTILTEEATAPVRAGDADDHDVGQGDCRASNQTCCVRRFAAQSGVANHEEIDDPIQRCCVREIG